MSEQSSQDPEFGKNPEDIAAFNDAISALNEHNSQFSLGKLMADALIESAEESARIHDLTEAGATEDEARQTVEFVGGDKVPFSEEEEMARSVLGITNAHVLGQTGLGLSPPREQGVMLSAKGKTSFGKVNLQFTDGGKFSSFLGRVDAEAIDDSFKQKVSGVVGSLLNEVRSAVSSGTPDANGALEALAYSQGIANGLERVGANEEVIEKLRALGEHSQSGTLYEYVRADSIGLLVEPDKQQFGPSQWQRDATPDYLRNGWGNVLEILKTAKENPDGAEMFDELTEKAKINLAAARADLEEIQKEGNYSEGYGDGFPAVFDEVEQALAKISG